MMTTATAQMLMMDEDEIGLKSIQKKASMYLGRFYDDRGYCKGEPSLGDIRHLYTFLQNREGRRRSMEYEEKKFKIRSTASKGV